METHDALGRFCNWNSPHSSLRTSIDCLGFVIMFIKYLQKKKTIIIISKKRTELLERHIFGYSRCEDEREQVE